MTVFLFFNIWMLVQDSQGYPILPARNCHTRHGSAQRLACTAVHQYETVTITVST